MLLARAALPLFLLTGVAACSPTNTAAPGQYEATESVTVKGQLTYRERIALPSSARAVLTLSDVSIADKKALVIKTKTIELEGRQVPIPFSLKTESGKLQDNRRYALRGTIIDPEDQLLWTTDTVHTVQAGVKDQDLGELRLVRVEPRPALRPDTPSNDTVYYDCGDKSVKLDWHNNYVNMTLGGKTTKLPGVVSASGAKFETGKGADRRMFWNKGEDGTLEVGDKTYECEKTGAPEYGDNPLAGEWSVTDINGKKALEDTDVTLNFTQDGKLNGSTGCNNYGAGVEVKNGNLEVSNIFQTKRACIGDIGDQETRFTSILSEIETYDIDDDKLVLTTASGKTLTARK